MAKLSNQGRRVLVRERWPRTQLLQLLSSRDLERRWETLPEGRITLFISWTIPSKRCSTVVAASCYGGVFRWHWKRDKQSINHFQERPWKWPSENSPHPAWQSTRRAEKNSRNSQIHKLVMSYPRRLEAVLAAKGSSAKYWVKRSGYLSHSDI